MASGGPSDSAYDLRVVGDDAPGLSALLDEYMQEVAQANSLQTMPLPSVDLPASQDFPDDLLLGDFQLSELAQTPAQHFPAWKGQSIAIAAPATQPGSQHSFAESPGPEAGRSDR